MKIVEAVAYILHIVGVVGDHVSTIIGLNRGYFELNRVAAWLMENGLWTPIDIVLTIVFIIQPAVIIRKWRFTLRYAVLLYPIVHGTIRLAVCIWNLHLI